MIDVDGHVFEPDELWEQYLPTRFHERRPQLITDERGTTRYVIEGKVIPPGTGVGAWAPEGIRESTTLREGGVDSGLRLADMDTEGIDIAVLYGAMSLGLYAGADQELTVACCRAYNNWLADWCSADPKRLRGTPALPLKWMDEAVAEAERCVTELGFVSLTVPCAVGDRNPDHPDNDPLYDLAEQHFETMVSLLGDLSVPDESRLGGERPLRVELLSGSRGAADRRSAAQGLAAGDVDIVVGTHALISEGLEYRALGVVVIDEQHRFGVEQRAVLRDRGPRSVLPDLLVMTATPIPRTAAMTVYGDLDVSVLDELPAGRLPVATSWARGPLEEAQVWGEVRAAASEGRQAYVVCPVIEESEVLDVRSVIETHERLTAGGGELAGLRVGLLHGRVTPAEKEATMELFRSGRLDVLVATTVIEVGVDVPNATVMVVVDAGRFGIAQLHQLRGRVGRSHLASSCYLLGEAVTAEAEARLEAVVSSNDGFELAEADLELRGEGTIMGERQKGRNDLRLASLRRDKEWVAIARDVAIEMIDADPDLLGHRDLADEIELLLGDTNAEYLLKS